MNCCGMSGTYGIDCNHIDPFNTGRRCVPFRAEKRLFRCTRAHALRWQVTPRWGYRIRYCGGFLSITVVARDGQFTSPPTGVYTLRGQITPRWGCRNRCCGNPLNHINRFTTGRPYVAFRAEKRLLDCTRAHALRWQITPRGGYRNRCCGNSLNHINRFTTGGRFVAFRAGPCLLGCTRVYTLSWQVTPHSACRNRCCGNSLDHISRFTTRRRCVPLQDRSMPARLYQGLHP